MSEIGKGIVGPSARTQAASTAESTAVRAGIGEAANVALTRGVSVALDRYLVRSRSVETMTGIKMAEVGKAVLADLNRTGNLYQMVANQDSLSFNLEMVTDPEGAVIKYRRRTEDFKTFDEVSNTTIENLPVAHWCVHVELAVYSSEEKWHDAADTTNHKVVFIFKKSN